MIGAIRNAQKTEKSIDFWDEKMDRIRGKVLFRILQFNCVIEPEPKLERQ